MKKKIVLEATCYNKEYKVALKNTVMVERSYYEWCGGCKGPCYLAKDCFYPYRFKRRILNKSKRGWHKPKYKNIDRRSIKDF